MADQGRAGRIEAWLTTAGTIAGALAGLGGFVYLVGGLVMWLRFRTADIPADQGVAVMSREQLFVIGLRLMVIPLLITGTVALWLTDRATKGRHGASSAVKRVAIAAALLLLALALVWAFAVAGWPSGLAVLLDAVVLAGGIAGVIAARLWRVRGAARPALWWLAPLTFGTAVALTFVLCLAVPGLHVGGGAGPRLAVAGAALVAMLLPAALVFVDRWWRPSSLRLLAALAAACAVAGWTLVAGASWWVALILGIAALALAAAFARERALDIAIIAGAAVVAWSIVLTTPWWTRLAIVLGAVIVAAALAAATIAMRGSRRFGGGWRRWWLVPAVAVAAVGLIVPWSFASATWPLGLGLMVVVWLWRRRDLSDFSAERRETESDAFELERRRMLRYMAVTAVIAAGIVSLGRQLDEPVQLLHATVSFKEGAPDVEGVYLNSSGDVVYIANTSGTIDAIPRSGVQQVEVGPPDERAPSPSLLSRIVPGERRFAARPLELWCDGQRYGWFEAGRVCETQPRVFWKTKEHHRDMDRLGMPLRVRCPLDPERGLPRLGDLRSLLHAAHGPRRPAAAGDPRSRALRGRRRQDEGVLRDADRGPARAAKQDRGRTVSPHSTRR